ncbi:hypothetical protein K2173_000987 [Erythroxylum novogranatense]|uniref:Pentatricopeptide repeat-containing protein n=1 Tax=Erythroxylum novogranatense TaxID=1862640 RepID=A0AAV8TQJ6_9ROSI|nr:hypothetical protein K2173_000987 [Erythroxylum novogranatense]
MSHKIVSNLSSLLRKCVHSSLISQAKQAHAQVLVNNYVLDVTIQTDVLLAYTKCGFLEVARNLFDGMRERGMHSWNILIASYVQNSLYLDAVRVFDEFLKMGLRPDHFTMPPLLKASAGIKDRRLGWMLHGFVVSFGFERYVVVGTSVMEFYLKCGEFDDAKRLFVNMVYKDSGAWNLIISGFGRAGLFLEALDLFRDMLKEDRLKVDAMTVSGVLNACGGEGDLMKGREIHGKVVKSTFFACDIATYNSLIDMYAKCGCLHNSEKVFRNMHDVNVVTWTTMISCYGIHGKGNEALALFQRMKDFGFSPNPVTLTAVLASCSHSGLINPGREIFCSMLTDYGFQPCSEHYACMTDLLGRSGHLEEALRLAQRIDLTTTASVWGALLAGCVMHKNVRIGEIAAHHLFELEPTKSSNYIALCSIYESCGMWDGMSVTMKKMKQLGLVKAPGCSWITIEGIVFKFFQGDHSDPMTKVVCKTLDGMMRAPLLPHDCHYLYQV